MQRRSVRSEKIDITENPVVKLDSLWMLLERARQEEENSVQERFIHECRIHPDFLVVLTNDRQLQELEQFCKNPSEFCIFSIDPTFNVFKDMILLTVTVYKNLKLAQRKTGKPPVFIGPVLLHQNHEWKTFSKCALCLITEQPSLAGIQTYGSDREKALTDGFKRNSQFAFGLHRFINFKKHIERSYQKVNSMVRQKVILCLKYLVDKKEN